MRHDDVNVLGVVLYEKYNGSEPTLYTDKECTKKANADDLYYAFLRSGVVVLHAGDEENTNTSNLTQAYARLVGFVESDLGAVCVSYVNGVFKSGLFTATINTAVHEAE